MRELKEKIKCKMCENEEYTADNFSRLHLKKVHNMSVKEYYNMFLKKENEDKCTNCSKYTAFDNMVKGYRKYCSQNCARVSDTKRKQLSDSWIGRDMDEVNRKYKETCLEKYGVGHYDHTEEFKRRHKESCLKNFGVEHNFQTHDCTEKRNKSLNDNKEEINKKRKLFWTPENIKIVSEKKENNNLEKYGVKYTMQLDWVVDKVKKTMLERYGNENIMLTDFFRKRQEENGLWMPSSLKKSFKEYRRLINNETNKWKKQLFSVWSGECYYTKEKLISNDVYRLKNPDISTSFNRLQPTIDHKISVYYGFMNNIEPIDIADISNLCICSRYINSSKNHLTEDEFLRVFISG